MKLALEFNLTVPQLAEAFAALNDERQAQFFVEVARIARTWEPSTFPLWLAVGKHLRDCQCSNDDARELVRDIAYGARSDGVRALS